VTRAALALLVVLAGCGGGEEVDNRPPPPLACAERVSIHSTPGAPVEGAPDPETAAARALAANLRSGDDIRRGEHTRDFALFALVRDGRSIALAHVGRLPDDAGRGWLSTYVELCRSAYAGP
jgi:hypothetical protein